MITVCYEMIISDWQIKVTDQNESLTGGCQENDTLSGKTCFTEKSRGGPGTSRTLTKPEASQTPVLLSSRNVYFPVSRNRSLFNTVKMEFRSVYTEFLQMSSIVVVSGSWHRPFSLRNHEQLGAGSPPNHRSYEKDRPFLMVISCIPGCFTNGATANKNDQIRYDVTWISSTELNY